jgi:flagella basal body P-ring formation protein FlgA
MWFYNQFLMSKMESKTIKYKWAKCRKISFLFVLLLAVKISSFSQTTDKEAIKAVVYKLFEGFEKNDSSIVAQTLHKKVRFRAINMQKTPSKLSESDYNDMLTGVAKSKPANWREIPSKFKIRIDNQMANVWVKYKFYLGDKFSHKGIDNFILYKEKDEWKIIFLSYTRR